MFTKKLRKSLLAFILIMAFALPNTVMAQPLPTTDGPPTIRVSGAGTIVTTPDIAMIPLGVSTSSPSPQEAIRANNARMNEVLNALRALGIEDDDINTSQFSLHPSFGHFDRFHMMEMGIENTYTAHNTVNVTIRDLDIVGEAIGAAVGAGANMSGNVWFSLSDPSPLYYEAMALAIQDAAAKARIMAQALGTSISGLINVTETGTWAAPALRSAAPGATAVADSLAFHQMWDIPIQSGNFEITARVEVVYSLAQ